MRKHLRLRKLSVLGCGLVTAAALLALSAQPGIPLAQSCRSDGGLPEGFGQRTAGMARIPGGNGVAGFWIDRTEVTNAQFAAFVKATGYVTEAERRGTSAVFRAPPPAADVAEGSWWTLEQATSWRQPEGPSSGISTRGNEPVTHVSLADARAYAAWLGRDLPTEAEWEWAAQANGDSEKSAREPRTVEGVPSANFWQGIFPHMNTREDGYVAKAPVACFAPNGFGLHDMIGNVWELTRDTHAPRAGATLAGRILVTIKGGSFLCSADYCSQYRASAREVQDAGMGASHIGFRTVLRGSQASP